MFGFKIIITTHLDTHLNTVAYDWKCDDFNQMRTTDLPNYVKYYYKPLMLFMSKFKTQNLLRLY